MIEARFDDLRPGGEGSFRYTEPAGVVEALRLDEVPSTIDRKSTRLNSSH